jgi:hypothetical protein
MKAILKYSGGLMIEMPKDSKAALLLLEWIANFNAGSNVLHCVIESADSLKIRLNVTKETYTDAVNYINNNL